jgi:hypothetical protein
MSIIKLLGAVIALAMTTPTFAQGTFNYVRIGDVDGFGFITGTTPGLNGEPNWPFNSPFDNPPSCPIDGSCSGGNLVNANGLRINVDGLGILTQGDFLPDLDCSDTNCDYTNYGTHYNSDEFDNRENSEIGGAAGNYVEASGATNTGSSGSGWTDVAVSGTGDGWNSCNDAPLPASYVCGAGQPTMIFDFSVTNADPNQPLYINAVFGDYDVDSASDIVLIHTSSGNSYNIALVTQNNAAGQDGLIQEATATIPFASVFPNWPASTQGWLRVDFQMPSEPFTAYDYAEIAISPLVEVGCCCIEDAAGNWTTTEMTEVDCETLGGIYQGDGVGCDGPTPPLGACCTDVNCEYTSECDCEVAGGVFYPGLSCEDAGCNPQGCCCYQDPDSGLWWYQMTSPSMCSQLNGYYAGDNVDCIGEEVPMGACCVENADGELWCIETSICQCDDWGGVFFMNLHCDDDVVIDACPPPPADGACCFINQDTGCFECVETSEHSCANDFPFGQWQGLGSLCSDPNITCCRIFGSCCVGNTCVWTIEDACEASNGVWSATVMCADAGCPSYCPEDVTQDGVIDIDDLLALLGKWGPCP